MEQLSNVIEQLPQPAVVDAGPAALDAETFETLERLRQPVDPSLIAIVDRGERQGVVCAYEWHTIADVLDERAPGWKCESEMREVRGTTFTDAKGQQRRVPDRLICRVTITINGVSRDNWGEEGLEKAGYGSAVTNAFAQAFKRAAAMFGPGRELYDKDYEPAIEARMAYLHGRQQRPTTATRAPRPAPRPQAAAAPAKQSAPAATVEPAKANVDVKGSASAETQRLARAAKQREQGWEVSDDPDVFLVFAPTPGVLACTCADYHFRESDVACKHVEAVQWLSASRNAAASR